MVWNAIAHPRMMIEESAAGNTPSPLRTPAAFDNVVFSKEALESPIKHMNHDLLATFDYIIWIRETSDSVPEANKFSKTTLLTGDFDSLFAAGKNKTIVNGLLIDSTLAIRQNPNTGAAEYYPVEKDGMNCYINRASLITPISLYGKMTLRNKKFDFGKDSFVMMPGAIIGADILIFPSGEVLLGGEIEPELMKYAVNEESGEA